MSTRTVFIVALSFGCIASGCSKGGSAPGPTAIESGPFIPAHATTGMSGCDHDAKSRAVVKHAWPYPADSRNIEWTAKPYDRVKLKLSPNPATFYTATVGWKQGSFIEVLDSWVYIEKPRRVIANEDILVTRKVWDQGLQVEKQFTLASAGDEVDFLFYNSRGVCTVVTPDGPAWTRCTLGKTFEGVTSDEPFACEQVWWVSVQKSKIDRGWMPFDDQLMRRLPPPADAAK